MRGVILAPLEFPQEQNGIVWRVFDEQDTQDLIQGNLFLWDATNCIMAPVAVKNWRPACRDAGPRWRGLWFPPEMRCYKILIDGFDFLPYWNPISHVLCQVLGLMAGAPDDRQARIFLERLVAG
jgi:hypothetical protein